MNILTVNSGSSSVKCALYAIAVAGNGPPLTPLWESAFACPVASNVEVTINTSAHSYSIAIEAGSVTQAISEIIKTIWQGEHAVLATAADIHVVGHRVVHGGDKYADSSVITDLVKKDIEALEEFAPLHNALSLEGICAVENVLGDVKQIAVFDTAFHSKMPQQAALYALPYRWSLDRKIKRYGFHGISHQYAANRAAVMLGRSVSDLKIVTCHLGNGCSLCAVSGGKSIDTTMGFTPLDGLMMGTRSGSLDPGILLYLLRHEFETIESLDRVLNHDSGLVGISGVSNDIRKVIDVAQTGDERCGLALDMFVHSICKNIGSMLASMGGASAIVFTGGIGEHSPLVRRRICEKLAFLDIRLDDVKNQAAAGDVVVSTADSSLAVLTIKSQEQWSIAQQCWQLCRALD